MPVITEDKIMSSSSESQSAAPSQVVEASGRSCVPYDQGRPYARTHRGNAPLADILVPIDLNPKAEASQEEVATQFLIEVAPSVQEQTEVKEKNPEIFFFDHRYDPNCYKEQIKKGRDWIMVGQISMPLIEPYCEGLSFEFTQATGAYLDRIVTGKVVMAHLRLDQLYFLDQVYDDIQQDQVFIFLTSTAGYTADEFTSKLRINSKNGRKAVFLFVRDMQAFKEYYIRQGHLGELLRIDVEGASALMEAGNAIFRSEVSISAELLMQH